MSLDLFDRFQTTLASPYTAGGGSLSLTSGSGLPSGTCNYYLIVRAEGSNTEEVFHVTNRSGSTLTVTGAQANTSASNHAATAVCVAPIMTQDAYTQLKLDAAAESSLVRIDRQVLVSDVATITISSIPGTYIDLVIMLQGRTDSNNDNDIYLQANTDTATNYDFQEIAGVASSSIATSGTSTANAVVGKLPGSGATAGFAGIVDIVIAEYAGTTFNKQATSRYGLNSTTTYSILSWWQWRNTAAITSLKFLTVGGVKFKAGTTVTTWGRQ